MSTTETRSVDRDFEALAQARHSDPFAVLGPHDTQDGREIRTIAPGALGVSAVRQRDGTLLGRLDRVHEAGIFAGRVADASPYRLRIEWPGGLEETEDPYSFGLLLGELDLHLIGEGRHYELGRVLGAQCREIDGVRGVRFAVWAPNARRVSVVGDFNNWDGRRHPMRARHTSGVWELFVPRLGPGRLYKYEIVGAHGDVLPLKADPVALASQAPPSTASMIADPRPFHWSDEEWMARRGERQSADAPISTYELHPGSWIRDSSGNSFGWHDLADRLIPYVADLGFTHIELLPIMEHPFGGSWGYQPLGLFAPTARFGSPPGFARFVDRCHAAGLGVILDWVPAHFPNDAHGLAQFDGTALYEHADPREGVHRDWDTLIYNFGRHEVTGFLVASAMHWLEHYHVDGLRVDAVASMLYRDYSRQPGEWIPNVYGGRENLEAIAFIRQLNEIVAERCPGAITIAEESTAFPGVSAPVGDGGLGFSFKWNMGWMHDTLSYMQRDPIYRRHHHHEMTFGLIYAFSEKFVLPLSHDEVVHGKGSLIGKMPGDDWQKLANLRAYYGFMWSHPGKKLLFAGCEIGQRSEWSHDGSIEWHLLDDPMHRGLQRLVRDLNRLYAAEGALHRRDARPDGFAWLVGDDSANAVLAYVRRAEGSPDVIAVCNMTPVPRHGYRLGVPAAGAWDEIFNSDAELYGGSNVGNGGRLHAEDIPAHDQAASVVLTLPPLATVFLRRGN